jgi:sigma-B regulation protein RsbU (phosphoserine phosphatase)
MPPIGSMQTTHAKLPYVLLALLIVGSGLFYVASTAAVFDSFLNPHRARPPFDYSHNPRFLVEPMPESQRAGMEAEDEIVSINGVPFTGMAGLIRQTFHAHPGDSVSVVYRGHSGQMRTAQVRLMPQQRSRPTITRWLVNIVLVLLFPAFCLLLGYWVVLARPLDWNAWFLLGIMNVVPAFLGRVGYFPGFLTPFTIFWQNFAFQLMFVSLILFSIYFPVRSRTDVRHPWLKWLIIVPQIPLVPAHIAVYYGLLYYNHFTQPYLAAIDPLDLAGSVFASLSLCIFIAAIIGKLFAVPAPAPDARRRLTVVAVGSVLGLGPVLVLLVTSTLSIKTVLEGAPSWALFTVAVLFTFFPLSLAYTVIVQRALDLRIILRQGTRYAFARGTLWALQAIVFIFLGFRLVRFTHASGRVGQLIAPIVFVLVFLFLQLRVARPLSQWIDRRFFREAYSVDQVLVELSDQARTFTETEPLLRTITERISQTLHVDRIAFLMRQGKLFRLQYAQGIPATIDVSLPENSSTMRALAIDGSPKRVFREHPDPWLALAAPAEINVLDRLDAELLLPLPGRNNLIGVMALGPKLSEEPYSRSDRRLLSSVALQTGLAIENSTLVHHLAEESAQRQRINREIEIARQVQEQLLPQIYPLVKGLDFAGFSRTAQEVGGDYYDFIALENGRLGIAIGDVSGKGISAALLMASIRSALHGLTFSGSISLARLIEGLNRIIYDSSTNNRFVTFFFGEYDPGTRILEYVNAGHNAPVLLRPLAPGMDSYCDPGSPCTVQRLETGGPVIGILTEVRYEQGSVQLQAYDTLVAFTDGISEAMTAGLEEWGEERLIAAAREGTHLSAQDAVTALVARADRFTAGAPQNDDLSVIVLKVI